MEAQLVELSPRDLLLVGATLITAVAAFETGYVRDLKNKIKELKKDKPKDWLGWPNWRRGYKTLWIGFSLFSLAALITLLVFFVHSLSTISSLVAIFRADSGFWPIFWSLIAALMVVGWLFLMFTAIKLHDYRDPVGTFKDEKVKEKSEGGEPEQSEKKGV